MPDLTAFLEARAALDEHLSRLASQRRSEPRFNRRRRGLLPSAAAGGSIAIVLTAVVLLPHMLPTMTFGEVGSGEPRTLSAAASISEGSLTPGSAAERKRDRAIVSTTLSGPDPLPPDTKKFASGVEGAAGPSRGDIPKPGAATPAPTLVIARLVEPNPPGRYDFEQEAATTGAIGPSKPAAPPIIVGGRTAQAGTGTRLDARPADASAPSPKITAARRRTKAIKETAPVPVKRVRSGVAELLAWVMPVQARPAR
jgi:hypothetical protein